MNFTRDLVVGAMLNIECEESVLELENCEEKRERRGLAERAWLVASVSWKEAAGRGMVVRVIIYEQKFGCRNVYHLAGGFLVCISQIEIACSWLRFSWDKLLGPLVAEV